VRLDFEGQTEATHLLMTNESRTSGRVYVRDQKYPNGPHSSSPSELERILSVEDEKLRELLIARHNYHIRIHSHDTKMTF